jgi:alginate O-acetyltransferase complex protein AlgJ
MADRAVPESRKDSWVMDAVFVALFAAVLCSGAGAAAMGFNRVGLDEKRALTASPTWPSTLTEWAALPHAFDQYVNDHFGLRNELIALNSYSRYRLGVSASPKVLVGNRGWLFYISDVNWEFFRGKNRLSDAELRQWLDRMEKHRNWLAERGIQFLILAAPVKESIYPEYLPYWLRREKAETQLDQIVRGAATRPGLTVIDVRKQLLERKRETAVYQAFDTHWNDEGGFIAYTAIMQEIARRRPEIARLTRQSFELVPARRRQIQQDLAQMLGIDLFVQPECPVYIPRHLSTIDIKYLTSKTDENSPQLITTGIPNTPKIILIRDSFSAAVLPYMEDTFGWLLVRHHQDGSFPQADIEKYRPDIVLLEAREAGLDAM